MPSILVTGASRGIGAAIACALANAGFIVGCVSRSGNLPAPADVPDQVRARWRPIRADVTDSSQMRHAVEQLVARDGPLAGLVNNAGIHEEMRSAEMSREHWDAVMSANALSTLFGCQAAYPHLVAGGGGLIVNIGSFFDKLGVPRNLAYCASKAAVGAITRVLAVEWAKKGIHVLDVAPGYVRTDLNREALDRGPLQAYLEGRIPRGHPGRPEEVGALVAMLFGGGASFLTGETIYVDGGQSIGH